METMNSFPNENIDPRKKGRDFCLQYARAAWGDSRLGKHMFYQNAREYDLYKSYANGMQDTSKYKKPMHLDDKTDDSWVVLDFSVLSIPKKHRHIALGRLWKSEYNIVATPIDALARDEADKYFASLMAKIMLRQQLQKQNPQLAQVPVLQPQGNEPIDLEELELQKEYGFKHDYAIAAEEGIDFIFYQNAITKCRRQIIEDLFDYGVAVYKDWMEPDGKIKFRRCDPRSIITNYCRYPDFRDIRYCGEVVEMTWQDFREAASGQFDEDDFGKIYEASKTVMNVDNQYGTPRIYDTYKVRVLDIEFFSDDEYVYEDKMSDYGNPIFAKTSYKEKGKPGTIIKKRKNVYRAKWIIGTNYVYDFGLANYMKRNGITNTKLSYHIEATNFHEMQACGIMKDLIPIADQMTIAWLKIQLIRNELKPYYIDIDLDGLEDVALAKGGQQLSPKQLLEMWQQNGILLTRRKDLSNNQVNYETIKYVETNYGTALQEAWNDFRNHIQLLSEATGFNEATDGSTVNPKNLNSTNEAMQESTNNALYHITVAEENLLLSLADAVLCRLKRAVKMGKVAGYVPAMGSSTIKYIEVSPDIDDHDYGLMLENKAPIEQKQFLQQEMSKYAMDGTLQPVDMLVIENCRNLKQAEKILAMRVNRRKQEQQQMALQNQQMTGQMQVQSAQAAEQAKQGTLKVEHQFKMQEIQLGKEWDYKIALVKVGAQLRANQDNIASNEKINDVAGEENEPIEQTPLPQQEEQGEPQEQPQLQ